MTKQELEKLRDLYRERDDLKRRIAAKPADTRSYVDTVYGSRHEIPYDKVPIKVRSTLSYETPEERKLKARLQKTLDEIVAEIDRIEALIEEVEDSKIRTLLRLKYIDCLQWDDIAIEMGYAIGTCRNLDSEFWKSHDIK